ncbi:ArsR/SmtB family transcription factor [Actinocrispum wychmicini]|uniref:DNA-binding transcriptional ArsR family regulator n=1 Tax=Actinocrispum wychmicini TaxID=1213861 RepID=A0A4R2JCN5_9PSEU|nr:winged helix-turn-helix domain-containing protein [Actinocrispum wychmicini]TCO55792.1 DNA-binding transcriptional ArsR family regulator [Actinocrispum wychmicini]
MTSQLVFDREDLQRVRLAERPDPVWELILALRRAQARAVLAPFRGWRRSLDSGTQRLDEYPLLQCLVAVQGEFPDFLPPPDKGSVCEAAVRTPATIDLAAVFAHRTPPQWMRSLATSDRKQLGDVLSAIRDTYQLLVAPHWTEVLGVVTSDRLVRARSLAAHGVGTMLSQLPGVLGWDGTTLSTRHPESRTVHLAGRGLTLVPSYFCRGNPITWIDPQLRPVLVYQAHGHKTPHANLMITQSLISLLGRTRAECLRMLLTPRTTSDLAQQLGTSIGTASKQTTVLRDAGLITSNRNGPAVIHTITSLGLALLTGTTPNQ